MSNEELRKEIAILAEEVVKSSGSPIKMQAERAIYNGDTHRKQPFIHNFLLPLIKKLKLTNLAMYEGDLWGLLYHPINNYSKEYHENRTQEENNNPFSYSLGHLLPLIDIEDGEKEILWNKEKNAVSNVCPKAYKKLLGTPRIHFSPCSMKFNPYSLDAIRKIEIEGRVIMELNLYFPPPWHSRYLEESEIKSLKCPKVIQEFLEHLIPSQECREFFLDWCHFALISRCETYLVLNGAKGIGKNLFVEKILSKLIGEKYFSIAPESALDSHFNSYLAGKRLILLDETKIDTESRINKLKRYINQNQNIERKGQDADKVEKTYNSFIISNNYETDIRITWDDRRFSVMDLTKKKLEEVWDKEKINEAANLPDEVIREFGYWVFYRKPSKMRDEFTVFKGDQFYRLCYTSLPEWAKCIADLIASKKYDYLELTEVKKEYRKRTDNGRMPRNVKIQDFLNNYRHNGAYYLGTLIELGDDWRIQTSKEFMPDKEITKMSTDDLL